MMTTGMLITGQKGAITTVRSQIAATIAAHALPRTIKKNVH
jgi:ribosomal protein L30E